MSERFTLYLGDCIEVMRTLADNSVDSIVTDPPYHLTSNARGSHTGEPGTPHARARIGDKGFMGQTWDGGDIAQRVEMWAEALRVLKPGGHLLAFSGTRTQHRMVCAIEDAGFEVRDQIGWLYGSGFPKSRNIAELDFEGADAERWAGWGTALKPAWEPVCVARKPLAGTVANNVLEHGTGALNIDGCRITPALAEAMTVGQLESSRIYRDGEASAKRQYENKGCTNFSMKPGPRGGALEGRWPANIIHDGSDEVLAAFPTTTSGAVRGGTLDAGKESGVLGEFAGRIMPEIEASTGSAARFFYCAKASRTDRNEGLPSSSTPAVPTDATMRQCETADWTGRNGNHHPTVKPTDLMAYLCRLVTPPGGLVLDPFMGSGSTGKAAMREGFRFVGIDMTPEYVEIARARIEYEAREYELANAQLNLFGTENAA